MYKKQHILLILLILFCCVFTKVNAQQNLNSFQDSLIVLSEDTFLAKDNTSRIIKNTAFVKKFIEALKVNNSFDYDFDSLKRITILKSPDKSFRIITWYIPIDDGSYRYYGTIQMATPNGSLKLFPLNDHSNAITNTNDILTPETWLGARYYEILPIPANGKQPYFILLGWKGNDLKTTKKLIEVLSFENGLPVFGKSIFEVKKNKSLNNRVIFQYNKLNTMTLTYDKNKKMIVFDHLVPYEPTMEGNFEFYATDSSFDGYKLTYGKLTLVENIELKNNISSTDDSYIMPIKASKVTTKGRN